MIREHRKLHCHVHHVYEIFYTDKAPPYPIQSSDLVCRLAAVWASFSLIHGQFYVLSSHICYVFVLLPRHWLPLTVKHTMLHQRGLSSDGVSFSSLYCLDANILTAGPETLPLWWKKAYSRGSCDDHRQLDLYK